MKNQMAGTMRYFSGDIEVKDVYGLPNTRFAAIGGVKSASNYYDGYQRLVGHPVAGPDAVLPVTRKIYYKKNPSLHICDVRCQSATGHNCECQCGGQNHGIAA